MNEIELPKSEQGKAFDEATDIKYLLYHSLLDLKVVVDEVTGKDDDTIRSNYGTYDKIGRYKLVGIFKDKNELDQEIERIKGVTEYFVYSTGKVASISEQNGISGKVIQRDNEIKVGPFDTREEARAYADTINKVDQSNE